MTTIQEQQVRSRLEQMESKLERMNQLIPEKMEFGSQELEWIKKPQEPRLRTNTFPLQDFRLEERIPRKELRKRKRKNDQTVMEAQRDSNEERAKEEFNGGRDVGLDPTDVDGIES